MGQEALDVLVGAVGVRGAAAVLELLKAEKLLEGGVACAGVG